MRRALVFFLFASTLPAFADITVSTMTPAAGPIAGGTIVHIHGTNLLGAPLACAALQCSVYVQFGDALGTVIFDSADEIVVVAPAHAAGSVDLVVNVPVSPLLTLKNAFTYEDPADANVRVLLPIAAGTQGILNTNWQTDIFAHNETTSSVDIAGTTIPPMSTRLLTLTPTSTGMFLQIPRSVVDGITITAHIRDTTHDRENLGVDVPSVPETQFRRAIVLPGVPTNPFYRGLLRVYGYPGNYSVVVRERNEATNEVLSTQTLTLSGSDVAYLQMPINYEYVPNLRRIEVTTARPNDPPIWAFITFTNNTTQSVTTITPNIAIAPVVPSPVLSAGHWGHAGYCMDVVPSGPLCTSDCPTLLRFTYGCSYGQFLLTAVDADGHFEADGDLSSGGAFPKTGAAATAHLSGLVTGGTLALTITGQLAPIGPVNLNYNSKEPCSAIACP